MENYYYKADNKFKGDRYEGEFKEGELNGQGTYYFNDGRVWKGQFSNGEWITGKEYEIGEYKNLITQKTKAKQKEILNSKKEIEENNFKLAYELNKKVKKLKELEVSPYEHFNQIKEYYNKISDKEWDIIRKELVLEAESISNNKYRDFATKKEDILFVYENLNWDLLDNDTITKLYSIYSDKLLPSINYIASEKLKRNIKKLAELKKNKTASTEYKSNQIEKTKKEKENLSFDNEPPQILIAFSDVKSKRGIVKGSVSDNIEVVELTIDGEEIIFNKNGSFNYSTFVPKSGKKLNIEAIDSKGLSTKKILVLQRKETTSENIISFNELNPLKLKGKKNNNAIALIIGVANYKNISGAHMQIKMLNISMIFQKMF